MSDVIARSPQTTNPDILDLGAARSGRSTRERAPGRLPGSTSLPTCSSSRGERDIYEQSGLRELVDFCAPVGAVISRSPPTSRLPRRPVDVFGRSTPLCDRAGFFGFSSSRPR